MAGMLVRAAGGDPRKARITAFQGGELMTAGIGGHVEANQWEPEYLNSAEFIKHLHAEEKRLRAALTDLGLARQ